MLNEDQPRFFQTLAAMASAFRQEADEIMLEGYWMGLAGLSLEQFQAGAAKAMRTAKFMPTVAELRECAGVNLELEEKGEVYRKRMERIDRAQAERNHRDRLWIAGSVRMNLPDLRNTMRTIGKIAGPVAKSADPASAVERVTDEKYAAELRARLQDLAEKESTSKAAQ